MKMDIKDEIEWLIDRYGETLNRYQEDITFGGAFRKGAMQVYEKVIKDLQNILTEVDE